MEEKKIKLLIEAVKSRDILWNMRHPLYKNKQKRSMQWKIISRKLRLPEEAVKRNWKSLRDSYLRNIGINLPRQNADEDDNAALEFRDDLEFLKMNIKPRAASPPPDMEDTGCEDTISSLTETPVYNGNGSLSMETADAQCSDSESSIFESNENEMEEKQLKRLIEMVKRREILWNVSHPLHNDNEEKAKLWKNIGKKLGLSEEGVKKKWNGLRNSYCRNIKRKNTSGHADDATWKFQDNLEFLKETINTTPGTEHTVCEDIIPNLAETPMYSAAMDMSDGEYCSPDPLRKENEINEEKVKQLIKLVKSKKILWNRSTPHYRNNAKKAREWQIISETLGLSFEATKRKWANLRDSYCRIRRRKDMSVVGSDDDDNTWNLFEDLEFLRGQIEPRTNSRNRTTEEAETNSGLSGTRVFNLPHVSLRTEAAETQGSRSDSSPTPTRAKKVPAGDEYRGRSSRKRKTEIEETLVKTMKSVREFLEKPPAAVENSQFGNTEDELYCRSLIAKLGNFPLAIRNEAKIEMLEYLCKLEDSLLQENE